MCAEKSELWLWGVVKILAWSDFHGAAKSSITVSLHFGIWSNRKQQCSLLQRDVSFGVSASEPGVTVWSPWVLLHGLLLHQPSVMWQDFTLRQVERHLQGDEDGELKGNQLPPADPETLLQLLNIQIRDQRQKKLNVLNH